jgi:hypothetical protein
MIEPEATLVLKVDGHQFSIPVEHTVQLLLHTVDGRTAELQVARRHEHLLVVAAGDVATGTDPRGNITLSLDPD